MPNRVVRDGLIDSEKIDPLTPEAERFFVRLLLRADDFGRYHGNLQLLKSNLFPLKEGVTVPHIEGWLTECLSQGIIRAYTAAGKRYLLVPKFNQRHRSHGSKFPAPDDDLVSGNGPTDDRYMADLGPATDGQMPDNGPPDGRHPRTESKTKSVTESKSGAMAPRAHAHAVELPSGFPSSEQEAIASAHAAGMAIPEPVIVAEWQKAAAVGGCTNAGQAIRSWPKYLAWAASARADREARSGRGAPAGMSGTAAQRLARFEARSGVVPKQTNSKKEAAL